MNEPEKLVIEFDVEKTIERKHGYAEKLMKFRGSTIRYKGIIKDGELVAVLGRGYKLVPNEDVIEAMDKVGKGWHLDIGFEGWKLYERMWADSGVGALVRNSVDGTCALKVDAMIGLGGAWGVLVGSKVQQVYRRHTKMLSIGDLDKEVTEILHTASKYGEWLKKMQTYKAKDNKDVLKMLFDSMPKVYTKGLESMLDGVSLNGEPTVKDVYETVARRIWNADVTMTTKLNLFRSLNDTVYIIVQFG